MVRLVTRLLLPCLLAATTTVVAAGHALARPPGDDAKRSPGYVETGRFHTGDRPAAVTVAPDGTVWLTARQTLQHFTPGGQRLAQHSLSISISNGIAADAAGNLHLTDYSQDHLVHVLSPQGAELRSYGPPSGATQYSPWGLDIAADGAAYVANAVGSDLHRFRPDGSWNGALGGPGTGAGQFNHPYDVALGPGDRDLYVLDGDNHRIQRFDAATGNFLGAWGQPGHGPGQFVDPLAVDVTPYGNVLVLDASDLAVVQEFTPDGTFVSRTQLGLNEGFGLAVDAAGSVYVTGLLPHPDGGWGVVKLDRPGAGATVAKRLNANAARSRAKVRVRCEPSGPRCRGAIVVRAGKSIVARGRYAVAGGRSEKVGLRLTASARAKLRKHATVRVRVVLVPSAGAPRVVRARLVR